MLKIKDFTFQEDWGDRRSCLMFFKADREESASWAVDIGFKPGDFEGNEISPSICINPIDTDKSDVKELVGTTFSVKTVEESEEREDSFYIYENEPLIEYRIEVLEIVEAKAHIKCNGVLILDGYAEPWIEEKFEIDSWIPVSMSENPWAMLYEISVRNFRILFVKK